ncbi:M14 family metallopeptidase [Thalassobaculum sp.]|uniref:M14 family metallopeptidase n=1 Tax=Thalassobaculum sp. TaxID=2022740 RepID=UPI0032ED5543
MDLLTSVAGSFAETYGEAREKFLAALSAATGTAPRVYANPLKGPQGEDLACEAAWIGPEDASRVLVLISATHGVEGFCGSGMQVDWLADGGTDRLPEGVAVLLVHALNCHGFAWWRRVTEEGCDLNRNFIDFSQPIPDNPGHDELVDAFVPDSLDPDTLEVGERKIAEFRTAHGELAFQSARKAGQYRHAHSVFFGGFEETWSRRTLTQIFDDYRLGERAVVSVVDVHTGLGPFGYGEPICGHKRGSVGLERVLSMYGHSTGLPAEGQSFSIPLHGTQRAFWQPRLDDRYTYVALEFGTFDTDRGRRALRADHWLHNRGDVDWDDPQTRAIKMELRTQYFPATDDWKEMVLWRGRQILRQTLEGLARFD